MDEDSYREGIVGAVVRDLLAVEACGSRDISGVGRGGVDQLELLRVERSAIADDQGVGEDIVGLDLTAVFISDGFGGDDECAGLDGDAGGIFGGGGGGVVGELGGGYLAAGDADLVVEVGAVGCVGIDGCIEGKQARLSRSDTWEIPDDLVVDDSSALSGEYVDQTGGNGVTDFDAVGGL